MPRIAPLPLSDDPAIRPALDNFVKSLGFVPNAALIMQRKPKMAQGFAMLSWSMWGPDSEVDVGFKRLLGHVSSKVHGCAY
jgi:hypothetical protein